jgi:hypothetical protein
VRRRAGRRRKGGVSVFDGGRRRRRRKRKEEKGRERKTNEEWIWNVTWDKSDRTKRVRRVRGGWIDGWERKWADRDVKYSDRRQKQFRARPRRMKRERERERERWIMLNEWLWVLWLSLHRNWNDESVRANEGLWRNGRKMQTSGTVKCVCVKRAREEKEEKEEIQIYRAWRRSNTKEERETKKKSWDDSKNITDKDVYWGVLDGAMSGGRRPEVELFQ